MNEKDFKESKNKLREDAQKLCGNSILEKSPRSSISIKENKEDLKIIIIQCITGIKTEKEILDKIDKCLAIDKNHAIEIARTEMRALKDTNG